MSISPLSITAPTEYFHTQTVLTPRFIAMINSNQYFEITGFF